MPGPAPQLPADLYFLVPGIIAPSSAHGHPCLSAAVQQAAMRVAFRQPTTCCRRPPSLLLEMRLTPAVRAYCTTFCVSSWARTFYEFRLQMLPSHCWWRFTTLCLLFRGG